MRTGALFPVFALFESYLYFVISYFLEDISLYLALWLFGLKYFEVSLEMQRMLDSKGEFDS